METSAHTRWGVVAGMCRRPWVRVALIIWAFFGAYDIFVSQFLSSGTAEKFPRLYDLVVMTSGFLPWWGWLLVLAAIFVAASIEYAHRKGGVSRSNAATIISALRMTVGESGPYFQTEGSVYDIRRTFNLKLENIDRQQPISNCAVRILSVIPQTDYDGPWLLRDGVSLAAGDHVFIPLVTYGEAREPDKNPTYGDTFMTMGTANGRPCLDVGEEHEEYTVTLRATAQNTAFCDFECRVWVDENGRLRIEEA